MAPFVGGFNFSNFQRAIELTAVDFPELSGLDPTAEPTFLKVSYVADASAGQPPETVFLGRLRNPDTVRLQASVPLSVTSIDYELFSETIAIRGRIDLEAP